MPIRKYSLAVPFEWQTSDSLVMRGTVAEQWRSGVKIDSRNLAAEMSEQLIVPELVGGNVVQSIYVENRYMALKTLTGWQVNETTGIVTAKFSDGNNIEIGTHADGVAMADALDANGSLAETVLIATAYRHSPDGTALADAIGSTCAIDTAAASNPIIFTPSPDLA